MSNRVIFSKALDGKLFAFKFVNDKIHSIEYCDTNNIVGNIYIGIVGEVVKNINAAFVHFGDGLKGYYLINDNRTIFLNNKNTNKLCQSDKILVQVLSDKVKTKEYTLTSNITLTGKYVVLTVGRNIISISKKIKNESFREELKNVLGQFCNDECGFIVRTSCIGASIQDITDEINILVQKWKRIKERAEHLTACSVVERGKGDVLRIATEAVNKEYDEIITDCREVYEELCLDDYIMSAGKVRLYEDEHFSLSKLYSLETIINDSLNKRVWLKSGAYLVIEHTEALNVIDVNTGKAVKKGNREDNFYDINIEAAKAIAEEIRKRNLSGIIVIDFINMKNEENNKKLVSEMKKLVFDDEITTTVAGITNLGLMEITRKRVKKPLYEFVKADV